MAQVHKKGLTQLYDGNSITGEPPKVNIVFIHGLGGHPRRTWSTEYSTAGSDLAGRRSSADTSSTGRKNSTTGWSRFLKRSNTGTPVSLADRSNSIAPSVISTEGPVSPSQILEKPLAMEPEIAPTPTLSTNKKSVYWPQDLLPQDFPNARIYTFGYDSKVATMSTTGQRAKLTFTQHAHDLHMTLNKELDDVTPTILCAHSLGGVLSKRALWESKTANNPELQKLARLTKVIIFFGTPHKGARKARLGEIATQVVSMAKLDTAQHLVSSLKLDSEILDIIHADFLKLLRAGDFYVHTFSEGRSINSTFGKIVEEYSSRIDEVSELQMHEVIDGDHRTMIQYKGAQDPGYRKVVSALKHYMNKLDKKHDIERVSLASMASSRDVPTRTYISLPHERNEETFVGRKDCIDAINMLFLGPKHTPFVVLHGLGGIGKTQVAIELAYRFKNSSPLFSVFWVHAQTAQTLDEGFRKILETLEIPHSAETNVRTAVAEWLRNKMNGHWLLVVDNVDDLSVLDENGGKGRQFKLLSCLPKTDHGHVLFTTRYRTLAVKITKEVVRLDQMSKTESMELLKRSLAGQYDESEEHLAEQLLEELSYIPLAISQAAGYMFEAENTIAQYLEYYRESEETRMELLQQGIVDLQTEDEGTDVLEDEDEEDESKGPKTVLKTSWMSFKRMKSDTATGPLANDLLSITAFLNRQEIPLSLLKKYRPKVPSLKLNDAFKLLKGYSLVIENTKTNTFSMHRLVQFSLRKWLEKNGKADQYQKDSLILLSNNFPDGSFKTWDECKALIVHADTVLEHSTGTDDRAARAKLLQNCANFQNARGQYAAAEEKIQEVVKLRTELVGADNTETLRATDQLAWTLWNQAKKDECLALAQRTLTKKEQIFGKRSVEALTTSHIVATVVGGQGKHQEAARIHEENIEARNELLGLEHVDTLRSASSLSLELWQLGQFVKAEDLARRTLASREKLLGEEHPDTLEIAGTLGFILEIQGKLVEAEDLKSKMLNTRLNIYGEDHPDTADSYHDMGWIYHQMGRYVDAEPYYENALSAKLRLLGDTHWKTLTTFCNYPVFCCDKGEYDEAEERSKRLIATFKRVQGDMHPQTLDATGGLAVILRHQGKLEEAAQAARTSIDGRNVVLGPDHPWTLPPVSHWGYILTLQGDHKQGEQVIREALAGLEKSMGKKHNNVLTSLLFLSKNLLRQSTGPEDPVLEESEQLAQRAYDSRKKLLGEEHPYTYKAMHHLGRVKAARGQYEEAHKISLTALGGMRVVLGTTHPDVSLCDIDLRQMEAKMEELGIRKKGDEAEEGEVIDT